jgi:hypothetical protein
LIKLFYAPVVHLNALVVAYGAWMIKTLVKLESLMPAISSAESCEVLFHESAIHVLTRMVYLLWVFQRRKIEAELHASKESSRKASAQAAERLVNQVPEVEAKGMDLLL